MSKLGTENFPLIDQEGRRFTLLYPLESEIPDFAREIARSANGRAAEADDRTLAVRLYRDAPHGWLNDTMPGRYRKEQVLYLLGCLFLLGGGDDRCGQAARDFIGYRRAG